MCIKLYLKKLNLFINKYIYTYIYRAEHFFFHLQKSGRQKLKRMIRGKCYVVNGVLKIIYCLFPC